MDNLISSDQQLPVLCGIVFLVIVGIFAFVKNVKSNRAVQFGNNSFQSPVKGDATVASNGTPLDKKTGTVMTPAGRRSARLARRKED